nr:MAG TPA: hypothetical protein [Caudoviricetes sp.]DAO62107.1 MAG TPA: hypothetical protein [Bacteriophage sp.]
MQRQESDAIHSVNIFYYIQKVFSLIGQSILQYAVDAIFQISYFYHL